ncbi:uncharacterized protein LOC125458335 isoform X2 [Stegostoma tigrinum]|uniref:uncharacterized protein LOC125458335 isoform X2 n=1 Tax=Stegostoma tigrinum TaxID=3053191 RepID=UPI00202B7DA6|nr:uncharacterized protein LOC125458335 isoform X2 [Stegostoma tigrinum]
MASPMKEGILHILQYKFGMNTSTKKPDEDISASRATLPGNSLIMEENELYSTIPQAVNQFTVTVQKTEASMRCELHGTYVLIPGKDSLILKDPRTKQDVYKWPYNYLRRYGIDQATFTFEAGRRCDSGQGLFLFETKAVKEIFHIIDAAVKEKESKKKQQRLSLTSDSSEASTASSRQLLSVASLAQESSGEKSSSGGRMPPTKGTDSNRKVKKRKENRDRKGNTPSGAKGAERNLPTTSDWEGAGEIVYATVKYPKGKPTKVTVDELTVNSTTYRDSYSDDSSIDPVYENVSDIESLLSFEEEPSFLKDIQKSTCENSQSSFEDQNPPSPTDSVPDYENIAVEHNQLTSERDHDEGPAAREEAEPHQAPPGAKHKERDASLSSGASKATKAKFPAGIQEVLTDLYSKELSKAREGKLEKLGRSSELQRKY